MKSYTITVNGTAYDVVVEEKDGGASAAREGATRAASAESHGVAAGSGSVKISASVPGKVFKISVMAGQTVKAGDTIVVLESMKMEIPVVAPQGGTIASIDVAAGDSVENGDTLATMD